MTDRIDDIEERLKSDRLVSPVLDVLVREDMPWLIAEVRQLRIDRSLEREMRHAIEIRAASLEREVGQLRARESLARQALRLCIENARAALQDLS